MCFLFLALRCACHCWHFHVASGSTPLQQRRLLSALSPKLCKRPHAAFLALTLRPAHCQLPYKPHLHPSGGLGLFLVLICSQRSLACHMHIVFLFPPCIEAALSALYIHRYDQLKCPAFGPTDYRLADHSPWIRLICTASQAPHCDSATAAAKTPFSSTPAANPCLLAYIL